MAVPAEPLGLYRVQLNAGFGFDQAAALSDYLAKLGVSHLYGSPYLQAAPGSTHGYDVVDPGRLNEELGGEAGHARLSEALRRYGLGQVLDIVPNHMAIGGRENPWWWDVLENGPSSRYAAYFDIEWDPPEPRIRHRVLLPVLEDHYGRVLEAGKLRLAREDASFTILYHQHAFPVAPRSLDTLLGAAAESCQSDALAFIAEALGRLPHSSATDRESVHRRHRDKEVLRRALARLLSQEPLVAAAVDREVERVSSDPDLLDVLLDRQNYRLAFWKTAGADLPYRRFFDINTLVGLRVEDDRVFADTHCLVLRWLSDGVLDGVRIDHPDGLRDPQAYLSKLRSFAPKAWIVVEKILEPGEELPGDWPVAGTTGYDFLNLAMGLLVDPGSREPLTELYAKFTGEPTDYPAIVREKKHQAMREVLGSDVNRLTALFLEICEGHRRHRDYSRHELHHALREVMAGMVVYRTYVQADSERVSEADRRYVGEAIDGAKTLRPDIDPGLFEFLRDVLLLKVRGPLETELVMRFQQLTGPVMAKGVEDCAFYNFNRFVALNEVGGDPGRFGVSVEEFHEECARAHSRRPLGLLTTSTHDSKRSEDVRARLCVLSEIPQKWRQAVERWSARNERLRQAGLPDRNAEYLLYQILVGAWPIDVKRTLAYMQKAAREAKAHTSWTSGDQRYEAALQALVEGALADPELTADLSRFVDEVRDAGRVNSLAQTILKLTAPGVPDIYQGTELWDLSLVDPDNRRPVDYDLRRRLLDELDGMCPEEILKKSDTGLPKLWVIRQSLALRRERPELFGPQGAYQPLEARGARAAHVVAYLRGGSAAAVVPRLTARLGGAWEDTRLELPGGAWRNRLTGEEVRGGGVNLASLLRRFPVALLVRGNVRP